MNAQLLHGDCLERLKELPDNSVDSVVTDPPYGLGKEPDALAMLQDWLETGHHEVKGRGFMGKKWDAFVPQPLVWRECLRVLKPGGHLLAFAGTRTQDLMCLGLRLAGFEIRDLVAWVYGSGFPKSLDVSKAIDKAAGAEREVVGPGRWNCVKGSNDAQADCLIRPGGKHDETAPATDAARQWQGWGTALKPALEPVTVARKPLVGTVAANVLAHGTGAINVDGCRVGTEVLTYIAGETGGDSGKYGTRKRASQPTTVTGRWPANLIHDGSEEVVGLFPDGHARGNKAPTVAGGGMYGHAKFLEKNPSAGDSGSAARFFYCAKASKRDRDEGLEHLNLEGPGRTCYDPQYHEGGGKLPPRTGNFHPTVKPTALMRYLCRLVTPPGGTVLDPFMGSGSTGKAAMLEGFQFIGIEREAEYLEIAKARIEHAAKSVDPQLDMPGMV